MPYCRFFLKAYPFLGARGYILGCNFQNASDQPRRCAKVARDFVTSQLSAN